MKKLIGLMVIILFAMQATYAQNAKPTVKKVTTTIKKAETKTVSNTVIAKKEIVKIAGPTKKDGTADMRYKVNKQAKSVAGPTKKDGTADLRYKVNKPSPAKKN